MKRTVKMGIETKYANLKSTLTKLGSVAVAFSGGVDSTFLLAAAVDALGNGAEVLAVIGRSPTYPKREYEEALFLAKKIGADHVVVDTDELTKPDFTNNPPHRCFVCKSTLFGIVKEVAAKRGIAHVLEGSNADDIGDFRPGMKAARELGVISPLVDTSFTKDEIREMSRRMDLPTWSKPAFACLSSRVPYGQQINLQNLSRIERSEDVLRDIGIVLFRVRDHGDIARIEVSQNDIERLASKEMRDRVTEKLKGFGYKYVCLDLSGYKSGSMNATLTDEQREGALKRSI